MRPYTHLLLAIFVLHARAATIPDQIQPEIEKELINDSIKSPIENISSEQELIDPANTIKDVQNNLRNNVAEDIPVEIILEEVHPTLKTITGQETANEVSNEEIQRLIVDVKNPGPAQRQEHETQNPEHYDDAERTVSSVKEDVKETQILLRQGFQGVTDGIQNWYVNNEHINTIQTSIQKMQENFASQIQKLNETVQNYLNPDKSNPNTNEKELSQFKANYAQIESRLKILQNNFNTGVRTLSEGVHVVGTLRDESVPASSEAPASSSTAAATPSTPSYSGPFTTLIEMFNNFQTSITSSLGNVTQAISNYFPPNQNWGIQNLLQGGSTTVSNPSETASESSTTAQPSNWQNFIASVPNFLNPNQASQTNNQGSQTGPFGIPNLPIVQNVVNLIQQNLPGAQTTQKPTEAPTQESNAGTSPSPSENPAETKPEPEKKPEQIGPIRQLLENNPIVQGINQAVQRIQGTTNTSEKPKDTEENNETEQEKSDIILTGNRGHGGGNGDSNDSGSRITADEIKETVSEDMVEEIKGTASVPEKTE